jgi:hypothetical protein
MSPLPIVAVPANSNAFRRTMGREGGCTIEINLSEAELAVLRELLQADADALRVEHHRAISHDARVLLENREEVVRSLLGRLTGAVPEHLPGYRPL